MLPIHSKTSRERIIRTVIPVILFGGLSVAFLWDGFIGYPHENVIELVNSLGLDSNVVPVTNPKLTDSLGRELAAEEPNKPALTKALTRLGAPAITHNDNDYYLGAGGHLRLRKVGDTIKDIAWVRGPKHDPTDLLVQKWLGYLLGSVGLAMILQLARVLSFSVELTEAGLRCGSKAVIPFDAMTALSTVPSKVSTVVELQHTQAGLSKKLRLDSYVIKEHEAIIENICEHAGLANPLSVNDAEVKQAEEPPVA